MLRCAIILLGLPILASTELVTNGNFRKGMAEWRFFAFYEYKGKVTPKIQRVDGAPTLMVDIPENKRPTGVFIHQPVQLENAKT